MNKSLKSGIRGIAPSLAAAAVILTSGVAASAAPTISITPFGHRSYNGSNNVPYSTNGYNTGYNSQLSGNYSDVDYHEKSFALHMPNGDALHIAADGATVLVNGQPTDFGALPANGNVQIIGTVYGDKKIRASEIRVGRGSYGGGYNGRPNYNGGYNGAGYNNGYGVPGSNGGYGQPGYNGGTYGRPNNDGDADDQSNSRWNRDRNGYSTPRGSGRYDDRGRNNGRNGYGPRGNNRNNSDRNYDRRHRDDNND